jgi:hypothetical protein
LLQCVVEDVAAWSTQYLSAIGGWKFSFLEVRKVVGGDCLDVDWTAEEVESAEGIKK